MLSWPRQLATLAFLAAFCAAANAQPLLCEPAQATPFTLDRVEPDGTIVTQENKRLRLAGVVWPDALEPERRKAVHERLERALARETLTYKPAGAPDRWGIESAHVFVREHHGQAEAPPFWLQAGLAEAGVLPAWPELPELCWKTLMTHERIARRAHRGYWAPRAQAARHRAVSAEPEAHLGRRMVARWKVFSTRKSQILTYVNITPRFRVGPSVGLTRKQVEAMPRFGPALENLSGRYIVARLLAGRNGLTRVRLAAGEALMLDED